MPYQKPPKICPVCEKEADFKFIQDYKSDDGKWSLYECSGCRVQFWQPMKAPGRDWYEAEAESWRIRSTPREKIKLSWQHKEFLKVFEKENNKGKKLLDLGCGAGDFLSAAQKIGFETWGVDFDQGAIKHAKSLYNLKNVYAEPIEDFFKEKDLPKFDVITFFEVIEHLDDIPRFLNSLIEIGKDGAYIILSTPNRERGDPSNPKINDLPPKHLTRWDYNSLNHILRLHNISIEKHKYGDEVEYFISKYFRLGTVRKLQRMRQKEDNLNKKDSKINKVVIFVYSLARIKDYFLTPIAWLIVNTLKLFKVYKGGDCIFLVGKINKSRRPVLF